GELDALAKIADLLSKSAPNGPALPAPAMTGPTLVSRTIAYTYDGLNRLTNAHYCNGLTDRTTCLATNPGLRNYNYIYDLRGNRTQQKIYDGVNTPTTNYTYDLANRITNAGYLYNNNGNLTADGTNTYVYDAANRLASFTGGGVTTSYAYNGLGDRYRQ